MTFIKFIRIYFPNVFIWLKKGYLLSPLYRAKLLAMDASNNLRKMEESKIIRDFFNSELIVRNGPFKGMKYISESTCSALLPKIMGSYEEPLHGIINKIISEGKYKVIVDIGCAEGYYAVGFAMQLPNTKVYAFDIETSALLLAKNLIELNKVINVELGSECTHELLNNLCHEKGTLIFCDIEGYEKVLLDIDKVPNLKYANIVVESHDCFIPNITNVLVNRFYKTHAIQIFVDYPFRKEVYLNQETMPTEILDCIFNERRSDNMKYLYLESRNGGI